MEYDQLKRCYKTVLKQRDAHHDELVEAYLRIEQQEDRLMWAYCKEIGSDSIVGLGSCDNYKDWINSI